MMASTGRNPMNRAWRLADGRYRLLFGDSPAIRLAYPEQRTILLYPGGEWVPEGPEWPGHLIVPEKALARLGAEKVFGVVTGPSYCGCEPAMFRWVGASEVEVGRTDAKPCPDCSPPRTDGLGAAGWFTAAKFHQCDIIHVCGEADVAREVYDAEFAGNIGALS